MIHVDLYFQNNDVFYFLPGVCAYYHPGVLVLTFVFMFMEFDICVTRGFYEEDETDQGC